MTVYKIDDIIKMNFLKLPKALLLNPKYKKLSSDSKLAYAILLDRLSLSQRNGWINNKGEVYLRYSRKDMADILGVGVNKATRLFRELVAYDLIIDERHGQGGNNTIYVKKAELTSEQVQDYVDEENARNTNLEIQNESAETESVDNSNSETPKRGFLKRCFDKSRVTKAVSQEPPNQCANNTNYNYTDFSNTDNQSIDDSMLDAILENCEIGLFDGETRKMLINAIEQMFYSRSLAVCGSDIPGYKVRSRLCDLTHEMLESAVLALHQNKGSITRRTQYIMSVIYNSLFEDVNILHTDPYLNYMRGDTVCT